MTTPKDARLAFALLKIRQSEISKAIKKVAPLVDQEPGDKNTAKLGEAKLGKVAMTEPTVKAVVTDPDLFTKWAQEHRPDQVQMVAVVFPAYVAALLDELTKKGALVDSNGIEVAGVEFAADTPQQRFYAEPDAGELLDVVDADDLPEIEGVDLARLLGVRMPQGGEAA